jgi:hypothetical protein
MNELERLVESREQITAKSDKAAEQFRRILAECRLTLKRFREVDRGSRT